MSSPTQSLTGSVKQFERTITRRNSWEVAAAATVALVFGLYAGIADTAIQRVSALSVGLAAVFVAVFILLTAGVREVTGVSGSQLREAYRSELRRHARLLRTVPIWYVGPLVITGITYAFSLGATLLGLALWVTLGILISWANMRAARDLETRALEVDSLH